MPRQTVASLGLACGLVFSGPALASHPAFRVKDIRAGTDDSRPDHGISINGIVYFSAFEAATGVELWKSDGTETGTVLAADIVPGPQSSNPESLTASNGTLFFITRGELWRSDANGTRRVFAPEANPVTPGGVRSLADVNGTLYFVAPWFDEALERYRGLALWKSDGTRLGTQMVAPVADGPFTSFPFELVNLNGVLYFVGARGGFWRSDGTAAGTVLLGNFNSVSQLTVAGGRLFFQAFPYSTGGSELWMSDGTSAGTALVKDINPAGDSNPSNLHAVGDVLFFTADDGTHGVELWKSDGTSAGTTLVREIYPGAGSSDPSSFASGNGVLYFAASRPSIGRELWRSDGTTDGTYKLKDIWPGKPGSAPSNLAFVNGILFFSTDDGIHGVEPWRSDGTAEGTYLLKDVLPGGSSEPWALVRAGASPLLLFTANDGVHGYEPWRSDGTTAGTTMVRDIASTPGASSPHDLVSVGKRVYFGADDGIAGDELWTSDGTEEGTTLVKNIGVGGASGAPRGLTGVGGAVFFVADDGQHGRELWRSDGTEVGTVMVRDIAPGPASSAINGITNVAGEAFFIADDGQHGSELWKSDGTAEGTTLVRDITGDHASAGLRDLISFRGALYFMRQDELWRSDGTETGTVILKSFSFVFGMPALLTVSNDSLFFVASPSGSGPGLWKSDGTAAGTAPVRNFPSLARLTDVNGVLFFVVRTSAGTELWKSDGTAAGTVLVKELQVPPGYDLTSNLQNVGGELYFANWDALAGVELFKSDGTVAGTGLVRDIRPGLPSGLPDAAVYGYSSSFTDMNGTLFFRGNDGTTGLELWTSNGTTAGTKTLDVWPGRQSSTPTSLTPAGPLLFFAAADDVAGTELWATDLIYADGFESGDPLAWSASAPGGGQLTVSTEAAMASTSYGLQAHVDDTGGIFVRDDSPNREDRYRARFYLDPHDFDPGEALGHHRAHVFLAFEGVPQRRVIQIVLQRQAGAYRLQAQVRLDDESLASSGPIPITDGPHSIEFDWRRATAEGANDGSLDLWIDGLEVASLSALDNDRHALDYVRLGVMSLKSGASGTLFLDEFESRRLTPIGPR